MLTAENIKRSIAIVVLACFFLPLCQCTAKMPPTQNANAQGSTTTEVFVPYEKVRLEDINEVVLVTLFVWPLCFWALRRFAVTRVKKIAINSAEIVCGLASLFYLGLFFRLWGDLKYGGVIALFSFAIQVAVSAFLLVQYVARKRV
ncbi:hypothetical protein [Iodobacter fluviatilis]|uniref:Uncharacterized protein n=1 Tax=Iodobacter fluviatilis TaxID=537 RepID=A0A377Q7J2_9NEIS|nr:hypothetical protein [Iodobacter fluviatilis]TCU89427.1 hypothetical protein EV682_102339 [Iodobacter fluviatilis]STQ90797.1 Uncharacterised protein [Iodobacter fluviatilis]